STAARVHDWDRDALYTLIGRFTFSQTPFYPSHWMAEGLQAAAQGRWGSTLYYLALIWSNGLLFYVLSAWASTRLYRRGFNRMATGGSLRKRYGGGYLDRGLGTLVRFLDPQIRLLIVKDFRTFRRDPAQWAQVLIFTGLLVLYFLNIHNLGLERVGWTY